MISLITTVYNEEKNIKKWLASILTQSLQPDEIIIVDGGSTDDTYNILKSESKLSSILKVAQKKGNISTGRNEAIRLARNDVIVVADAGCIYDNNWLEKISSPVTRGEYQIFSTAFGPYLKESDSFLTYLIASSTTPAEREFKKDWLPSSRSVCFRKELWKKVNGYPEWLPICEDIVFDLQLKKLAEIGYERTPLVFWETRKTIRLYMKQLYKYTKSDGHANLWLNRQIIRYVVYIAAILLLGLIISQKNIYILMLLTVGMVFYIKKFWVRWFVFTKEKGFMYRFVGFFFVPVIVCVGDVAKMAGWPVGVYERLTKKIRFKEWK